MDAIRLAPGDAGSMITSTVAPSTPVVARAAESPHEPSPVPRFPRQNPPMRLDDRPRSERIHLLGLGTLIQGTTLDSVGNADYLTK